MQADDFKAIIFADETFRNPKVSTDGNVTTYAFSGTAGNSLYPQGNLSDILIQVTKSDDLAVGDLVTVKIPASMIPLRHFKVDTNESGETTMTVDEAWPIRLIYGASVKPAAVEALKDGLGDSAVDEALKAYMNKNNTDTADGHKAAVFYSNLYTGRPWQGGKTLGDTIASFEPAKGNTFYYFTENTPIYTDEAFESPVKAKPVSGDTYYYKKTYWALENGKTVEKTEAVPFASSNFDQASANWAANSEGEVYIKAGSARLTRVDSLTLTKKNNATNTATEVINPSWDNVNNPSTLHVSLGNNGSLALEVPGALEIQKDATVAENKNLNEAEIVKDKEFTFKISIPEMSGKTVRAEKRNLQGEIQGQAFELTFDESGETKAKLKDNERLYIHGLDAGAAYTVTEDETAMPAGFKLTSVDDKTGEALKAEGTIEGGISQKHTFVNTYDVTSVKVESFAPFEKIFERWDLAESFSIALQSDDAANPMPEGTVDDRKVVEVTEQKPEGNFGTIEFTQPGTYNYTVAEMLDESDRISGVDYSMALYDVEVKVSDNGDGTLTVDSVVIKQTTTDVGAQIPADEQKATDKAVFTNTFSAESTGVAAFAWKNYTDTTGGSLKDGQFSFKMRPRYDLDEGTNDPKTNRPQLPEGIVPDEDGSIIKTNTGSSINFGLAMYNENCIGNTYAYELTEVVPDGVTEEKPTLNGMTYDLNRYLVKMAVSKDIINGEACVSVSPTYYKIEVQPDGKEKYVEIRDGILGPTFVNRYEPEAIVLPDEGKAAIQGRKTLKGRDSLTDEAYEFTLSAANEAASTALANDWIVFENNNSKTTMTAKVDGLKNGQEKSFNFGEVKFTRPGRYQFNIVENAPENGSGMVYDRHTALVTVTVTDNNGKLEAAVVYNNGQGAPTDAAVFTNTYSASMNYGAGAALNVSKTLNGRGQALGEFKFKIEGTTDKAEKKLTDADKAFATIAPADDGVASMIFDKLSGVQFDETDAGKTFTYIIKEDLPEDDDKDTAGIQSKGVTYTQMQYKAEITVKDNGDGTMASETKIYRTHDDAGQQLAVPEELGSYNSSDGKDTINVIAFVNSYKAKPVTVDTETDANVKLTKQLTGRSWKASDKFEFTLTAAEGTPLPMKDGKATTTAVVTQAEGTDEKTVVPFGFGTITFTEPGNYYYMVSEAHAGETIDGITYDAAAAYIWVTVTDDGDGKLKANVQTANTDFVNVYASELNHNAAGGIVTAKTLVGHDMAKQQFTFLVEAMDGQGTTAEENAKRIGIKDGTSGQYRNDRAAKDGETIKMKTEDDNAIKFTLADVGKTFVYKFSEMGADGSFGTGGTKDGYTYDDASYVVELSVTDDGDGTLTLHTKVTDKDSKVTEQTSDETKPQETVLEFNNSYAGSGKLDGAAKSCRYKEDERSVAGE